MEFKRLLKLVGDEPVFESSLLFAGETDPSYLQRQLSRWVQGGYLYQLRRGLYALAPPYTKTRAHPFLIANRMVRSSYVSCQSALAHYGLIPEYTPTVTSVTTRRPAAWNTGLGRFEYRHVKTELFFGYTLIDLGNNQRAFVSQPEKAILDQVHLTPEGDTGAYLRELRLQNLDQLNLQTLWRFAEQSGRPKLCRAARLICELAEEEAEEYEKMV
jgi:predicted transcriptional regulator of viral defense system